ILHLIECRGRLHQPPKLNRLVKKLGCGHHKREDNRGLIIAGAEPGQLFLPLHDLPPVTHHIAETPGQVTPFAGFAMVQSVPCGVPTQPKERKTEIGFELLVLQIEAHDWTTNGVGEPCADKCIVESEPHHIPWNIESVACHTET